MKKVLLSAIAIFAITAASVASATWCPTCPSGGSIVIDVTSGAAASGDYAYAKTYGNGDVWGNNFSANTDYSAGAHGGGDVNAGGGFVIDVEWSDYGYMPRW